ncbi:MAG: glycosyltransferase family 2 protein [Muribaculum sp.]|nr:glycosyltransferase family 2 protein [Muribaculaceae bacterium]MCM1080715.1 glycosyltransferase family 2 protein [Muribaculum sp.]
MLTVSIVTYHVDLNELEKCLLLLRDSAAQKVYVIDNAAQMSVQKISLKYNADYTPNSNTGYGSAHNVAIRKALSEGTTYHLVMNTDLEFHPEALKSMIAYMDSHPEVGQMQPRIINPDGKLQHTCRRLPTPLDLIIRRFIPKAMFKKRRSHYLLDDANWDKEFDCAYQQGSFMLFRANALRKTGLFDERFFMYPEDIDLSRRMATNYKVRYWPGATVIHRHRAASYHSPRMLWIHITNMIRYFNKWGWFRDPFRRQANTNLNR